MKNKSPSSMKYTNDEKYLFKRIWAPTVKGPRAGSPSQSLSQIQISAKLRVGGLLDHLTILCWITRYMVGFSSPHGGLSEVSLQAPSPGKSQQRAPEPGAPGALPACSREALLSHSSTGREAAGSSTLLPPHRLPGTRQTPPEEE